MNINKLNNKFGSLQVNIIDKYAGLVSSVFAYGTETWATKKANLHSLERTERMMVRWLCGVSLKDRKRSVDLYSSGCTECGGCGEVWQVEVVWASEALGIGL